MKSNKTSLVSMFFAVLPHINLALSLWYLTVFFVDRYNRLMALYDNEISRWMLAVYAVLVLLQCGNAIWRRIKRAFRVQKNQHPDRKK